MPASSADGDALGEADALAENLDLLKVFDERGSDEPPGVLWSNRARDVSVGTRAGAADSGKGLAQVIGLDPIDAPSHQGSGPSLTEAHGPAGALPVAPPADPGEEMMDPGEGLMDTDEEMIQFLKEVLLDGEDLDAEEEEDQLLEQQQHQWKNDSPVPVQAGGVQDRLKGEEEEDCFAEDPSSLMFEPFLGGSLLDLVAITGTPFDAPLGHQRHQEALGRRRNRSTKMAQAARLPLQEAAAAGRVKGDEAPFPTKTEAQMLSDALELLPDLDVVAEQLCVKYDIIDLPNGKGVA